MVNADKLFQILKNRFGYDDFRLDQQAIIETVLEGRDCLAIMPTGGGKSLCYQIPALYLDGVTIVVSPLISLMQDQVRNLNTSGIKAHFLNSEQSYEQKDLVKSDLRAGRVKILYMSPEGILNGGNQQFLRSLNPVLIAVDEAHCVSQWGHEFRHDYTRLAELKDLFPHTPTIALTATADERTRFDIINQLRLSDAKVFVSSFDRPNIKYMIEDRYDEIDQLDKFIKNSHESDTGIVYCLSRKKVEKTAYALEKLGHKAYPYHAGLSPEIKQRHQQYFDSEDNVIIVATIAFGMGIDRPDVRFVAHLDLPKSLEGYYQETGRAGRDGKESNAWMIYGLQDMVKHSQMLAMSHADESYKQIARHKLDSMLSLCETSSCRREHLLNYFGEDLAEPCGYCDTCLNPVETWDATVDAQKILSTIYRTGEFFGAGYIIDVLRGSKNAKVVERGHDKLSVHGIGVHGNKNHWNSILRQLLNKGYIVIKNWDYRNFALTNQSKPLLQGRETLMLRRQSEASLISQAKIEKKAKRNLVEQNHEHPELFERLRTLRKEISEKAGVPPYIVFGDKTLHEMCVFLPTNSEQFLMVNGVGAAKLEKYGDSFLGEIRSYL